MVNETPPLRRVLVAAPTAGGEFTRLLEWFERESRRRGLELERVRPSDLTRRVATTPPELAVVCLSTPDEISAQQVEFWLGFWPITRFVCCYGAWCDSDGRTRSSWPLPLRTPAWNAELRLRRELDVLAAQRPASAVTAAREEMFAWEYASEIDVDATTAAPASALEILIQTPDREWGAMLSEWSADFSAENRSEALGDRRRVVLWDADPWPSRASANAAHCIEAVRRAHRADDVVALLGFPRAEDVAALQSSGAAAVLPKLAPVATLMACLRSLSRRSV